MIACACRASRGRRPQGRAGHEAARGDATAQQVDRPSGPGAAQPGALTPHWLCPTPRYPNHTPTAPPTSVRILLELMWCMSSSLKSYKKTIIQLALNSMHAVSA